MSTEHSARKLRHASPVYLPDAVTTTTWVGYRQESILLHILQYIQYNEQIFKYNEQQTFCSFSWCIFYSNSSFKCARTTQIFQLYRVQNQTYLFMYVLYIYLYISRTRAPPFLVSSHFACTFASCDFTSSPPATHPKAVLSFKAFLFRSLLRCASIPRRFILLHFEPPHPPKRSFVRPNRKPFLSLIDWPKHVGHFC